MSHQGLLVDEELALQSQGLRNYQALAATGSAWAEP